MSNGAYTYKGCYKDTGARAIPTINGNVSSVDQCAKIAESKNQNVFGVQYGGECWTGVDEQAAYKYGANPSSCPTLGGSWTNQVYVRSTPVKKFEYKGCYRDTGSRAIPIREQNVSSVDQCALIAESKNRNVFGVQYGGECWTGVDEKAAYKYGANASSCPTLGGSWTNQVYAKSNPVEQFEYKGCYRDTGARAIPTRQGNVSAVEQCAKLAESKNHNVFGVQYGGECWTSDDEKAAYKYGANASSCPTLGGSWTNQVYVKSNPIQQCTTTNPTWRFQDSSMSWYKIKQNGYSTNWGSLNIRSNTNMSISFWLNINTLHPNWRNIFHLTNSNQNCCNNGDRVPAIWITPSGTSMHIRNSTTNNGNDGYDTPPLPLNSQLFITIVWSGTDVYVYVNSILKSQFKFSSPVTPANPSATFYIGDPWHDQNDGLLIKYFSIYSCSLTQVNILSIYNSQLTPPTSCEYQMSATELQCYKNNYPIDLTSMNNIQLQNHWSTIGCNQKRNNQCSSQQTSSGLYNYKGCYTDTSIRAIPTYQGNVSSIDQCAQIAERNNQNVFGVQYGGQCWTGINEQAAYQYGSNFNKDSCQTLGGAWTNQVYVRSNPFPAPAAPVPYLTRVNFANKENFENMLYEEERDENIKIIFKYIIVAIIIILLFIFIGRVLRK